jgi:hypothetical protein
MSDAPLIVEDTFARDFGFVVAPFLPHQRSRRVRLRYETPDGCGGIVDGHVEDARGKVWAPATPSPRHQSALVVDAPGLTVPVGTRIWVVE